MLCVSVVFSVLLWTVSAQSSLLEISANGAVPSGSAAVAQGAGAGEIVNGVAEVVVNDGLSASSVTLAASGNAPPTTPPSNPPTIPNPPTVQTQVIYHAPKPSKQYFIKPKPKCEDIKNDKCYKIDNFQKCGFCVIDKYPVTGYGCKYVEELVLKKSSSSKDYKYETVLTPLCDCDGTFILQGENCPSCDTLLTDLLKCAGVKDPKNAAVIEIPEKCLKTVGVTQKELQKCGLLNPSKPKEQVVVKKDKYPTEYVIVVPQKQQQVVIVPGTPTSTATASSSAIGIGATATASAVATAP